MATTAVHLGTLLDNVAYYIELKAGGRVVTKNPGWCVVSVEEVSTLQIKLNHVETTTNHSFDVLFGDDLVTYHFVGVPNLYM